MAVSMCLCSKKQT